MKQRRSSTPGPRPERRGLLGNGYPDRQRSGNSPATELLLPGRITPCEGGTQSFKFDLSIGSRCFLTTFWHISQSKKVLIIHHNTHH